MPKDLDRNLIKSVQDEVVITFLKTKLNRSLHKNDQVCSSEAGSLVNGAGGLCGWMHDDPVM